MSTWFYPSCRPLDPVADTERPVEAGGEMAMPGVADHSIRLRILKDKRGITVAQIASELQTTRSGCGY